MSPDPTATTGCEVAGALALVEVVFLAAGFAAVFLAVGVFAVDVFAADVRALEVRGLDVLVPVALLELELVVDLAEDLAAGLAFEVRLPVARDAAAFLDAGLEAASADGLAGVLAVVDLVPAARAALITSRSICFASTSSRLVSLSTSDRWAVFFSWAWMTFSPDCIVL